MTDLNSNYIHYALNGNISAIEDELRLIFAGRNNAVQLYIEFKKSRHIKLEADLKGSYKMFTPREKDV